MRLVFKHVARSVQRLFSGVAVVQQLTPHAGPGSKPHCRSACQKSVAALILAKRVSTAPTPGMWFAHRGRSPPPFVDPGSCANRFAIALANRPIRLGFDRPALASNECRSVAFDDRSGARCAAAAPARSRRLHPADQKAQLSEAPRWSYRHPASPSYCICATPKTGNRRLQLGSLRPSTECYCAVSLCPAKCTGFKRNRMKWLPAQPRRLRQSCF